MPDLSIVIVSYRTRELLDRCLRSILSPDARLIPQVIVVDNASGDGTAEMVQDKYTGVLLISNKTNLGYSAANNIGIRAARGRNVLLLNPDTETNPAALEAMSSFLDRRPRICAVGCQLLNTDGSLQTSHFNIPIPLGRRIENASFYPRLTRALLHLPDPGPEIAEPGARRVDIVKGACIMAPRTAFGEVGLLDENSFLYADDIDWCMRARRLGWDAYLLTNQTILHHGYASTDQETYLTIVSSRRSALLLYRKHYPRPLAAAWTTFIFLEVTYKYLLNALRVRLGRPNDKTKEKYRAYRQLMGEFFKKYSAQRHGDTEKDKEKA